jgi:RNA polymerase sigma-70 factor, ECF subfamily
MRASPQTSAPTPRSQANDEDFRAELIDLIPFLRAFARTLCGDRDEADDLCQEALAKAWQSSASFEPGTNLKAWLFMILRNHFYSNRRRSWRQQPWDENAAHHTPVTQGSQTANLNLQDLSRALRGLPDEQREALILVGAGGFSCEEASRICGCAVGTIKSRVARARKALINALEGPHSRPLGPRLNSGEAVNDILGQLDQLAPGASHREHRERSGSDDVEPDEKD